MIVTMIYDFKKQQKDIYWTKQKPVIIEVPSMQFLVYRGKGNPNEVDGDFSKGIELLYGVAYTLKMAHKSNYFIKDSFEYVVPPLEGYWWQENIKGYDKTRKDLFHFELMIRLPEFVSRNDFEWAVNTISCKKKKSYHDITFETIEEGLCVQCLHIGEYDKEDITTNKMHQYIQNSGYQLDISDDRKHHEIYLSDARRCDPTKLKTIIRHPIKKTLTSKVNSSFQK